MVTTKVIPGNLGDGKVGMGMCDPDSVLFWPLRFTNGPFFFNLKIGLDIGCLFAKCLTVSKVFFFYLQVVKKYFKSTFIQNYMVKILIGCKKGFLRNKWFR